MKKLTALILLLSIAFPVHSATPFDGDWKLVGTNRCGFVDFRLTIKDGEIADGFMSSIRATAKTFEGKIADDGSMPILVGTLKLPGKLIFQGDTVAGTIETRCGPGEFKGQKEKI
jgi:hypothetical protein